MINTVTHTSNIFEDDALVTQNSFKGILWSAGAVHTVAIAAMATFYISLPFVLSIKSIKPLEKGLDLMLQIGSDRSLVWLQTIAFGIPTIFVIAQKTYQISTDCFKNALFHFNLKTI